MLPVAIQPGKKASKITASETPRKGAGRWVCFLRSHVQKDLSDFPFPRRWVWLEG